MNVFLGVLLLYLIASGVLREFGRLVFWFRRLESAIQARRRKKVEA